MRTQKGQAALSLLLGLLLALTLTAAASAETIVTEPELIEVETAEPETDILPLAEDAGEVVASGTCGENTTWTLDGTGLLRISGTGAIQDYGSISTPINPDDPYIVEVHYYGDAPWYEHREQVTALVIDSGITSIGQEAFQGMDHLESVSFPAGLQSIGKRAFYGCEALKEVSFPAGMKSLGQDSFSYCHALTTVVMPDGLTDIGLDAFSYCSVLESVTLPGDLTSIPGNMFASDFALKSIVLPDKLEAIDAKAFYGCVALESVNLPAGLRGIGSEAFSGTVLSEIHLPDGLEGLGDYCFSGCEIETIVIPDKVTSLSRTFSGCDKLREVKLPSNIKRMFGAFHGCSALESIELPEGLESIENGCFSGCGLKEIVFPTTIREITGDSFNFCGSLEKITFLGNAPKTIGPTAFGRVTATVYYPDHNSSWTEDIRQDYGGTLTWVPFAGGVKQEGYRVFSGLPNNYLVDIDGMVYYPDANGDVFVPTKDAKLASIYEYNKLDGDVHEQYPIRTQFLFLHYGDKGYETEYPEPLQDLMQYAGSSIRITGKKGIRMITAINIQVRDKLVEGREGYTLLEYGTLVAWDSELKGGALSLENPVSKTAYAYKRGVADPIFKTTPGEYQFTNVLVGFSNDQCVPDLSMRPYMKLQDKDGKVLTVYGGVVHRSIGYIALQNRKAFQPGTDSYEYIWSIIHHVYGTKYDADYKK